MVLAFDEKLHFSSTFVGWVYGVERVDGLEGKVSSGMGKLSMSIALQYVN